MRTLHTCVAASGMLLAAAAAEAKPCSPNALCVLDAQDRQIGTMTGVNQVSREWKGVYYDFSIAPSGVQEVVFFLYASTDCSGTAYMQSDDVLPASAYFDQNKVLWAPAPPITTAVNVQSYWAIGAGCITYNLGPVPTGVATVVDATTPSTWVPPFRVKKIPVIPLAGAELTE